MDPYLKSVVINNCIQTRTMPNYRHEHLLDTIDRIIYHAMIAEKHPALRNIMSGMQVNTKMYFILLFFHDRSLNFKANKGISAIRR